MKERVTNDSPSFDLPQGWRVHVGIPNPNTQIINTRHFGECWHKQTNEHADFLELQPILFGEGVLGWQRTIESAIACGCRPPHERISIQ